MAAPLPPSGAPGGTTGLAHARLAFFGALPFFADGHGRPAPSNEDNACTVFS